MVEYTFSLETQRKMKTENGKSVFGLYVGHTVQSINAKVNLIAGAI